MITIKTYKGQQGTFYIQSKGLHSGRPMRTPKPNSFAITTEIKNAYEIIFALYKAKAFDGFIHGSVIPFITIGDLKKVIIPKLDNAGAMDQKKLEAICSIDKYVDNLNEQIKKYKELQKILSLKVIS